MGILPDWLDPAVIIDAAGPWALLVVCFIVFAETGLLVGFLLPGDTLLIISGLLTHTNDIFGVNIWVVALLIALAAFIGGEVGYFIGHKGGPAVFERKESGLFSRANVERTNAFFERFGGITIILARFVPIVRTFAPVAAGVGHMPWKRYSLYNLIGALLWGFGLTMFGYLIAYIPWVSEFVVDYIDLILLVAVGGTIIVTAWHYFVERHRARKAAAAEAAAADAGAQASEAAAPASEVSAPPAPTAPTPTQSSS
ncbi:VTT domain-containing protein [Microbacterium sp. Mu-80]|uniref:VTT domain-containing protein n=1 Tax=Microbacterium bandirmense TaxID=3122050 RepID=A0ABU8LBE9_9MICO